MLVFVHIPKTAGVSVSTVLRAYVPEGRIRSMNHPVDDVAWLASLPMDRRVGDFDMLEGHFFYGLHELLERPCAYMTMVRDPVERVLSYWSYVRSRPDHYLHRGRDTSAPLSEWIRRGYTPELDNFQTRCLAGMHRIGVPFGAVDGEMLAEARAHLDGFAWVGVTERFAESVSLLRRVMGWGAWGLGEEPRKNVTAERVRAESVDAATLELIRSHNALDMALHAHAGALLSGRLGERPPRCFPPGLAGRWSAGRVV